MNKDGKLAGKKTLVTGSGTGIGREWALEFARQGADVVLHYAHAVAGAESAAGEIRAMGRKAEVFPADFDCVDDVLRLADKAIAFLGGVDCLVNNAGITFNRPFRRVTLEQFDRLYNVNVRATFFGRLRMSYQSITVAVGLVCSAILERWSSPGVFSGIFVFSFALIALWIFLYARLIEVEKPDPTLPPLGVVLGKVIRSRAYLPFCAYAFLLALFTGGCPILFGMIEKTFLCLSDGTVAMLANLRLLGSILGFYIGGKIVEKFGTKPMFLSCHFGFGIILFLFLWRDAGGGPVVPILAVVEALFGLVWAASSVAFIVEMYALIPPESKSLSTTVFMTLQGIGISLGGILPAGAISLGMFRESWSLAGATRSDYDALLLICGALVVVMTVTLGLVPSVTGKAKWLSRE